MKPASKPLSRRLRPLLLLLLVIAAALVVRHRRNFATPTAPSWGAQWIWSHAPDGEREEYAFVAWRDFEIEEPPPGARLNIQAEPEWVLTLNGRRLGGGRWRIGDPMTSYEVGSMLRPGTNRILVDLRSRHKVGGLLISLVDGDRPLLVTDSSWRVLRRIDSEVRSDLATPETSDPVLVLGPPPTGHWGIPEATQPSPRHYQLRQSSPRRPQRVSRVDLRLDPRDPPQLRTIFDFGEDVVGVLHFEGLDGRGTGLHFTASSGAPDASRIGETHELLEGQQTWSDAVPRRLRYVVSDTYDSVEVAMLELDPQWVERWMAHQQEPVPGVFGLELPIPRQPDDRLVLPAD